MNLSSTSSGLLTSDIETVDGDSSLPISGLDIESHTTALDPALHEVVGSQDASKSTKLSLRCEIEIFASTFLTIFLAELGDKTQLTTLLMSAESQSPWVVFAGASAALVLTSLLGILLGRWLATKISPKALEIAAGTILLFISAMLFFDILQG